MKQSKLQLYLQLKTMHKRDKLCFPSMQHKGWRNAHIVLSNRVIKRTHYYCNSIAHRFRNIYEHIPNVDCSDEYNWKTPNAQTICVAEIW